MLFGMGEGISACCTTRDDRLPVKGLRGKGKRLDGMPTISSAPARIGDRVISTQVVIDLLLLEVLPYNSIPAGERSRHLPEGMMGSSFQSP